MYQLTQTDVILRISDGASIPKDTRNKDYRDYLAWLAKGNTPQPANTSALGPDYQGFLDQIIASPLYQKILTQSATSQTVNTAFTAAMGALILAAVGKPNVMALQSGIVSLMGVMTLAPGDIPAIKAMLVANRLDSVIVLPV